MKIDRVQFTDSSYDAFFTYWKEALANTEEAFIFLEKFSKTDPSGGPDYRPLERSLDAEVTMTVNRLSNSLPLNTYVLVFAALKYLLARYMDQHQVFVYTPMLQRAGEPLYAHGVTHIQSISREGTLRTFINAVKEHVSRCHTFQDFPAELIDEWAPVQSEYLTNVAFCYPEVHHGLQQPKNYAITFSLSRCQDTLTLRADYDGNSFTAGFVSGFLEHWENVLRSFAEPDLQLNKLPWLPADLEETLISGFNPPGVTYQLPATLVEAFETQVCRTPEAVAVFHKGHPYNYAWINEQANRLAHFLKESMGITAGDRVGVILPKSERMVVGLLGIMKAGGAYVPADPGYPAERLRYIVTDAQVKGLLVDADQMMQVVEFEVPVFVMDIQLGLLEEPADNLPGQCSADELAYIIYTSGSTGTPKGVMIEHQSILNTLYWRKDFYPFTPASVVLQVASFAFDSSVIDIFTPLISGGSLVLPDDAVRGDVMQLIELINRHGVTHLMVVPSLYQVMLSELTSAPASLRMVTVAGETLPLKLVQMHRQQLPDAALFNEYGPTENSVCSTACRVDPDAVRVSIGKPLPNVRAYVIDSHGALVPPGVVGQIALAGAGLARGYWQQDGLTNEKFVVVAFRPDERIYLTGDYGRWLPTGHLEYAGRKDQQIKIRGHRVELDEIEQALLAHPALEGAAVVTADAGGSITLVAFVVPREGAQMPELAAFLAGRLPDYMVPARFLALGSLPLTPHGKVDRKRLVALGAAGNPQGSPAYTPPASEVEKKLVAIWERILGKEKLGIRDNFFAQGGQSLRATQMVSRIYREFGVKLELKDVFAYQTVEELAPVIDRADGVAYEAILPVDQQDYHELSHAQKRIWLTVQLSGNLAAYNMPASYELHGNLNTEAFHNAFLALVDRHEMLRTTFSLIDNEPVQVVRTAGELDFGLTYIDLRQVHHREQTARELASKDAILPFNLETGPLLRTTLIQLEDDLYVFLLNIHHIVADAWSMVVLVNETFALYNALCAGHALRLPPLPIQYKDYAAWQNRQMATEAMRMHQEYWLEQFREDPPVLKLTTDYPRPAVKSSSGDACTAVLERHETDQLLQFGQANGVSLFMTLLASLYALLYRYTGQEDLVVGSPIAGRNHADLENQIGFYVNTLALRTQFAGNESFTRLLEKVKKTTLDGYEHQVYPFDRLVDDLQLSRDLSRSPLFDVNLVLQNASTQLLDDVVAAKSMQGIDITYFDMDFKTSRFDLVFNCQETEDGLRIMLEYNTDLFSPARAARMASHFLGVIRWMVAQSEKSLDAICYIPEVERQLLLSGFNETRQVFPDQATLPQLFEEQVLAHPGRVAVVEGSESLTYAELDARANQVARFLKSQALGEKAVVGLLLNNSMHTVAALLGILKAGLTYLPIDVEYPYERIRFILRDAVCPLLISEKQQLKTLNGLQWDCPSLKTYICLDTMAVYGEKEHANELMNRELWEYVGANAYDEISGGGWVSSYTGKVFGVDEMEEYATNILAKVRPFLHPGSRVLEIGCSSGITLFRIAPLVDSYYGIDFSESILGHTRRQVSEKGLKNVRLSCLEANEVDTLDETGFDVIILNSVVQSFDGHNYLREVLAKAISLLGKAGVIVVGDVQDLDRKEAFLDSLQEFVRKDTRKEYTTKLDWSHELFLSRRFFEDLPYDYPEIKAVIASPKIGRMANELNLYRFDAVLEVSKAGTADRPLSPRHKHQLGADALARYSTLPLPGSITANEVAYLIYTSGTENCPKGVAVTHRNLSNYLHWASHYYFQEPGLGNMALLTSIAFDLTVTSLFCPLLLGRTLYVYSGKPVNALLQEALDNPAVDTLKLTPSHVTLLEMMNTGIDHLKVLILGGEKLKEQHVRAIHTLNKAVRIYNEYGPTETTVGCTAAEASEYSTEIGKPIANTIVYITDDKLQLLPIGNNGEICVAGEGVAAGYLNNPELNTKKFVPNPFVPGSLLYRTGDLGKWQEDGSLVLAGRKDRQVKIRGNRIEPSEIEAALTGHPAVQDCVVVARGHDQEPYLTAYVLSDTPVENLDLPGYLSGLLPSSMVPAFFVALKAFPLTSNGKIDTRSLADPLVQEETGLDYVAPRNDTESRLAGIWQEVLRRDKIGVHENFFRIGGHSLKATQVIARIHQQMDVKVQLIRFFINPTIAGLATEIEAIRWVKGTCQQDEAVGKSRLEIII